MNILPDIQSKSVFGSAMVRLATLMITNKLSFTSYTT